MAKQTITLQRVEESEICTIGRLTGLGYDMWTLEDPHQEQKVWGRTRIPAGIYQVELRNEGNMTEGYVERYPDMHEGMIWLRRVPGFKWIYIHVGNTHKDTNGCILVGLDKGKDVIYSSRRAYERLYPAIVAAVTGGGCQIEVLDVGE